MLQVDGIGLDVLATDPVSPSEGQVWFNTTAKRLRVYSNGATKDVSDRKVNPNATAAPTVDNDETEDYEQQSLWFDTSNNVVYTCVDASTGAAVWVRAASANSAVVTIDETVPYVTSSLVYENAFDPAVLNPTENGNWFVLFEGAIEGSNNNTAASLAVGLNGLTAVVGSTRSIDVGSNRETFLTTAVVTGVGPTDQIIGLIEKESGSGTVTISNRSITAFRI